MGLARTITLATLVAIAPAAVAADWSGYVSQDRGFSLHYPAGWGVEESEAGLVLKSPEGAEVVVLLTLTGVGEATARECVEAACEILAGQDWLLSPSGWQPAEPDATPVAFQLAGTIADADASGVGLAALDEDAVLWLAYVTSADGYDQARASSVLQGIYTSLSAGDGSTPPQVRLRGGRADEIARAFAFVLGFALGDPLSAQEEQQVIASLLEGWGDDDEAVEAYTAYPPLVQAILRVDQAGLADLQAGLAAETAAWLEESDPTDPVVQIVRAHREAAAEVLVGGPAPLTRQMATAYAEMAAYSLLLAESPLARSDEVSAEAVEALTQGVAEAWPDLSEAERDQVGAAPAVWMCLRSVLEHGSPEDQTHARQVVASIADGGAQGEGQVDDDAGRTVAESMLRHQVMLDINQMTFNHYMWSRGFNSTVFGF